MSKAKEKNDWAKVARISFLLYKFVLKGRRLKEVDFNPLADEKSSRKEEGMEISWDQFTRHYARPREKSHGKSRRR